MPQSLSFDLDGTIVDTFELNKHCYERAGIKPPADFFGKPWQQWLPETCAAQGKNVVEVRARKRQYFSEQVARYGVDLLAAGSLCKMFIKTGVIVSIITGASEENARLLLAKVDIPTDILRLVNGDHQRKLSWIAKQIPGHIHIDDDPEMGRDSIFFHRDVSYSDLVEEIEKRWTRSYSPPAAAND